MEAGDVEEEELDVAGRVSGQYEAVKHQQQLPVQLLGRLPLQLTWTQHGHSDWTSSESGLTGTELAGEWTHKRVDSYDT